MKSSQGSRFKYLCVAHVSFNDSCSFYYEQGIYPTAIISLTALQRTTWDMTIGKDISQNTPRAEMRFVTRNTRSGTSTIQIDHHHPTLSVDERSHISEVEARSGEV